MLNDTTDPTDTTTPPTCHTSTIEIPRGGNDDDEYFHTAKQRTPANVGYMGSETRKEHNAMYSSESSDLKSSSTNYSTCAEIPYSRSSAVIVFIYGNKMFIGSIGDSRIVLVRQRCHYMDVMYLNEPPLAWFPLTAAKNSCFENKRYILFQEPIIRGGFLLDEQSIFLLMFNDGVTKNMLDMERDPRTSSQINQAAVQMVNKLLEKKYRTEERTQENDWGIISRFCFSEISRKVIAHIRHSYSRKCKPNANAKREGMSFLYADLRPLSASVDLPDHIRVKKACLSEPLIIRKAP
uniref:PPM-type phosphatase domain-containing protein n=1 Tax=Elaeophora elaphi TaxID=1147741 RepID=A0A0R3S2J1_9BILA